MSRFFPYFQPIVDVTRGCIAGYEALARCEDDNGLVKSCGPYFSNPSIDKNFLLHLDRAVRRISLARVASLPDNTFLTLNISPEWIDLLVDKPLNEHTVPTIGMIKELDVDPRKVIIEITETKGDLPTIQRLVNVYRRHGLRIAIDDYGAGHSELNRLIALEPDLIKLDMRIFKDAIEGGITQEVVQSVGFIADRVGCDLLCEGVETENEFAFAVELGANLIQGFLFYQAEASFVAPSETKDKTFEMLAHFIEEKTNRERILSAYRKHMYHYALRLSLVWQAGSHDFSLLPAIPEGFVRFYICNQAGEQLSPSYRYIEGSWEKDASYVGANWSGRPYFYQILVRDDASSIDDYMTSPYRDKNTHKMNQTLGVKLSDGNILLVDYLADAPIDS